ncbi:MAG TPA: hypothetical protein VF832_11970 [Longimicrobiales bacterium]
MRTAPITLTLCAGTLLAAACVHQPRAFDKAYDSGQIAEAARIFDGDSALWRDQNALFRTAAARATPGNPIYDPARAHAELRVLLDRFPQSPHRVEALRLDALLSKIDRLTEQNRELEQNAATLAARIDSATNRLAEERRATLAATQAQSQLQADLRRTEAELKNVQQELERLKQIDLKLSRRRSR